MAVKYKTIKNSLPTMQGSIEALSGRKINVGHLEGGELAWLAAIHEYGCIITVTPKMRVWLHAHGLHLKESTTVIKIPERSFLRNGFDENHEKVIALNEAALAKCLTSGKVDKFLDSVGLMLRDKIADYANDLANPPKHPFSLQMNPGKTNPLIITGDMIDALCYEVE